MEETSDLLVFNRLFSAYQTRFIRFANTYVKDRVVAEDFTLEAFMYYWEHRNDLKKDSNIPAYILTIIKHKCLNYLNHLQVKEEADQKLKKLAEWEFATRISTLEIFEPYELFTEEAQEIVNETLARLPEKTRKVFVMSRYQDKTHKVIAEEQGITIKTVEFHINKALKILRNNMKDYFPFFIFLFG